MENEKGYYIAGGINEYYKVCIVEDGYTSTLMVKEESIEGFVQCLEFLRYAPM